VTHVHSRVHSHMSKVLYGKLSTVDRTKVDRIPPPPPMHGGGVDEQGIGQAVTTGRVLYLGLGGGGLLSWYTPMRLKDGVNGDQQRG
jgi:hypothetical protein